MGGTLYDGDDSRHVALLHDDTIPKASHTSSKRVVAAIGLSLCVASALVGYSMMTSETTQSLRMPSAMNLESEQTTSNREFLLQIRGKNSLCIDDGGSTQPTFITQPCNPSDINQMFVYDPVLFRIRSARKTNLCVDDGGGLTGSQVRLWTCDQYNPNQRWVYDPTTLMFKNPTKNNLCLDDGGGTLPRSTSVILSTCDVSSLNQHFQIKFVDDGQAQQQATIDAVQGGAKFILRVPGKDNLCVDDANTVAPGSAILNVGTCDVENANQVFVWDLTLKRIRSFKKGWCMDDGGGQTAGSSNFILSNCDGTSKNQEFVYDKTTLQFRNPNKPNLCMDDGNGFSPGTGKLTLWYCDLFNSNQHFEYVLVPSNKTYPVPNLLQMGREFLLKLRGKNSLCVNDGGNINGMSSIKVRAHPCNPSDVNQMFVYDTKTYQLRSARKNNLCLDDGQLTTPGSTSVSLLECDINSNNQRWVYNATTQMFINPTKNFCLDDGSGTKIAQTLFTLWTCDNNSPNQHFEVKFVDDWQAEQQKTIDAIQAGAKFIMRVPGKDNLCVDDANTWAPGSSNLWLWTCDVGNMNQVFVWDATLKRIRSYQKGWCVDDGGGRSAGSTNYVLSNCDGTSKNQEFVYDKTTLQFRNPNKPNLCVDDNNGYAAGTGKLVTWYCDVLNPNQHFEYVLVSSTNTYPVADLCACLA